MRESKQALVEADPAPLTQGAQVASVVRQIMAQKRWNQKAVAEASGLSRSAVSQVVNGARCRLRSLTIDKLAKGLGVDVKHLSGLAVSADGPTRCLPFDAPPDKQDKAIKDLVDAGWSESDALGVLGFVNCKWCDGRGYVRN